MRIFQCILFLLIFYLCAIGQLTGQDCNCQQREALEPNFFQAVDQADSLAPNAFGGGIDWKTSEGEDKYRRGIYTTWRRSNPYPSMATFDAPSRETCTVRRERTNTPLLALMLMNDPQYVEAARFLAQLTVDKKLENGLKAFRIV